jgi:hypothetical protein
MDYTWLVSLSHLMSTETHQKYFLHILTHCHFDQREKSYYLLINISHIRYQHITIVLFIYQLSFSGNQILLWRFIMKVEWAYLRKG